MKSQRIIIVFVISQLIGLYSFAQKIIDSIGVCNLPVRKGVIYQYNRNSFGGCFGGDQLGVSILTKCDSVFHFDEGKVAAVNYYGPDEDAGYMVIIRNEKDEFICYSNLKYVSLKKGDVVKMGTWLGLTGISEEGTERQVDFVFIKNKKQLPFKRTAEYIRCNNTSCNEIGGYTL